MMWLLLATGFTGALTLAFVLRRIHCWLVTPPSIEAFHSPKGGCTEAVVRELKHARREILVQAYSFTSKVIAQALVDAKLRGVHVEIILDANYLRVWINDGPEGGSTNGQADDDVAKYGPVALYVGGAGEVRIRYASLEQLDDVCRRLSRG